MKIETFYSKENWDYELLDTGNGKKLERVGQYTFIRPYEEAVWPKTLKKEWETADGEFLTSRNQKVKRDLSRSELRSASGWKIHGKIEPSWPINWNGIRFLVNPTPFRHFGFFPEQASHWEFIQKKIGEAQKPVKFLNLFGYTGLASLFALWAGAEVTHIDASKQSLTIAKENQNLSGLDDLPMRLICDDALKFIEREAKRGNKYDAIIMDPPKFGRGPKGEVWKIEEMLPRLLSGVTKILSDRPIFVILTSYATDASSLTLGYALRETMQKFGGQVMQGELCLKEKAQGRLIPLANTAVWSK